MMYPHPTTAAMMRRERKAVHMDGRFGRRTLLGGAVGALAAAAAAPALADGALGASPGPGFWNGPSKLNRSDRVFLHRGLVHGAWVRSGPEDGWYPSAKLWNGAGFTTPQFYAEHLAETAMKRLEYSEDVMRGLHQPTWALARAPYGQQNLTDLPDPDEDWMTPAMREHTEDLLSICFGDEERFSPELRDYLAGAMAKVHEEHPWVLTHTNQALGQYPDDKMADYLATAKPDMLTWDWYPWMQGHSPTSSVTTHYRQLARYRRNAMSGHDGTGTSPLAFGQYTIGFRMSDGVGPRQERRVYISESQQNLQPYMTWAAGGKWLSMFRWELDEDYYNAERDILWESDGLFLTDAEENPLPAYHRYQRINQDMETFSPYLVRLRSRSVGLLRGALQDGSPSPAVGGLPDWNPSLDTAAGIVGLEAANIGTANGGHRGEVFVGTFGQLPELSAGENRGVLSDRGEASAFMLVNGMAVYNDGATDPYATGGSGAETRQRVTVTVDPRAVRAGTRARSLALHTLNRSTGNPEPVQFAKHGDLLQFTVDLDGGAGELFVWG